MTVNLVKLSQGPCSLKEKFSRYKIPKCVILGVSIKIAGNNKCCYTQPRIFLQKRC